MSLPQWHELSGSDEIAIANQIDLICDDFERAWQSGERPHIQKYVTRCDERSRERLFTELLLVDREYRIKNEETISRLEYQRQFPSYSTLIGRLEVATVVDAAGTRHPPAHDASRSPEDRLARFDLLEQLGSGAFGTVWKALDTKLRRIVAIKMPRQGHLSEVECLRFKREGQAIAQLRHPHIVAVYEVGDDPDCPFIVTEFVDGVNLRDWLRHHRLQPRESAELTAQLAEALHHAHDVDIVHRDLKPANVLIDKEQHPHITDFGLAKWAADSAQFSVEGNVLGTPAYMSPEQARGEVSQVDCRSDIYSLGAMLYEMLTGRPPFDGEMAVIIHKVTREEPAPPRRINSRLPRDLETICLKAMEKVPARRYATTQEMAVDLRRYLRGEPILARQPRVVEKCWRWIRRHPAILIAFILPTLILASAGAVVKSIIDESYRQQGYRPIRLTTRPSGARVAVVPVDDRSGEPNNESSRIIRPSAVTPVTLSLRPGRYFIEAVLPGGHDQPDFTERYLDVPPRQQLSDDKSSVSMDIRPTAEATAGMAVIQIDDKLRQKQPLLPRILYVDCQETKPAKAPPDFGTSLNDVPSSFDAAESWAHSRGLRLPSAEEYDAIMKSAQSPSAQNDAQKSLCLSADLHSGLAEWTTTIYEFPRSTGSASSVAQLMKLHVLKGYDDPSKLPGIERMLDGTMVASPNSSSGMIGWRCVRSGAPRFVVP